jgi:hypothetical protein
VMSLVWVRNDFPLRRPIFSMLVELVVGKMFY